MLVIRFRGRLLLLAAAAVALGIFWPRTSVSGQGAALAPNKAEAKYFGAASCASMACHNFNGPEGSLRSEYSTWANEDKHSKAFTVLHSPRSHRMARNLRQKEDVLATEDALCLKCHATNDGKTANVGPRYVLEDGVSCEACHGPSDRYLTSHYQYGFKEMTPEAKEKDFGLRNTKDLVKRAELCITCHVGDGSKEVNHDLIAAGHPRLNFEFAAYHGNYHKHWFDSADKARNKDFYARAWLVGQLVTAKSALDLLELRARSANDPNPEKRRPWPEFAEYACYACHKDLKVTELGENSPHHQYYKKKANLGSLPFGTWYLSALPQLTGDPGYIPASLRVEIDKVKASMERPELFAKADTDRIANEAKTASDSIKAALEQLKGKEIQPARMNALLRRYVNDGVTRADTLTWDEAAQIYLSAAALTQGLADQGAPILTAGKGREDLLSLRDRLKGSFPKNNDSPQYFSTGAMELPDKRKFPSLADQFKAIQKQLGN